MSHFPVLVIGPNATQQLAPFQENNMGDCPRQFLTFNSVEAESRQEYETGAAERLVAPDGSYINPYNKLNADANKDLPRREVPFKELFPSFDDFMMEYHGYTGPDEEKQEYGYWENPNAKWDWFLLGGRWTGYFKLKPGAYGEAGEPGLGATHAASGYADSCTLGAVDIDGMRAEARAAAAMRYDEFHAVVAGRPVPKFQDYVTANNDDYAAARRAYWAEPVLQDLQDAGFAFNIDYYANPAREAFLQTVADRVLAPHAILKDGVWYEMGSMGGWGVVFDKLDEPEWNARVAELLDGLPPETQLSLYDCHI